MATKKSTKKSKKEKEELNDVEVLDDETLNDSDEDQKSFLSNPKVIYSFVALAIVGFILWQAKGLFMVATVNNSPISRVEFIKELENRFGEEVLDTLITQKIIEQEANEAGITVTDVEINEQMETIRSSVELQGTTLEDALALQGQSEENLRRGIRLSLIVEKLFEDQLQVSDEDVRAFYEQNQDLYGEEATFEQLQGTLKDQMVQQQLSGRFQEWIENKKAEATIHRFVNFD